jgi:hypothetical protein
MVDPFYIFSNAMLTNYSLMFGLYVWSIFNISIKHYKESSLVLLFAY